MSVKTNENQLLDARTTDKVAMLELHARRAVKGLISGQHRSRLYGQSTDFVQHRQYNEGDELRHVDWKLWSRTDKYFLKQYEDFTNLNCHILLDASQSMAFRSGECSKFDFARQLAAAFAMLLTQQSDATEISVYGSETVTVSSPVNRTGQLPLVFRRLADLEPSGAAKLGESLELLASRLRRRSVLLVVSDLLDECPQFERPLAALGPHHQVIVIHVIDPVELTFDFSGTLQFVGLEQAGSLTCSPADLREGYLRELHQHLALVRETCVRTGCEYRLVDTSRSVIGVLLELLQNE